VASVDQFRLQLMARYAALGDVRKALEVADKIKDRPALIAALLQGRPERELLDYADRELDRMEAAGETSAAPQTYAPPAASRAVVPEYGPSFSQVQPLTPVPAGKQTPMEQCGKEWSMSTTTLYGLFPNGWDQEASHVPGYVVNETGPQLRDRLAKAFADNNPAAMKEFCDSFIRLDDIPLSSPWFDTSGGRLQGRIKYALNDKAQPVVELLRDMAQVTAESKKEFVALAKKSLQRIDAITRPQSEK